MNLSPITRRIVTLPVSAVDENGLDAALSGLDVAILGERERPSADTAWTQVPTFANGEGTFLVIGYAADPEAGALVVPKGGGYLWARLTDNPEVEAIRIEKMNYI